MLTEKFRIKSDKLEEWKTSVGDSCCDGYSFGVVKATIASFEVLDDPKNTCKDAESVWNGMGITGFMAGCAAQWISIYHERGEEFRKHWNASYGVTEEQANGGVVNPAVLVSK